MKPQALRTWIETNNVKAADLYRALEIEKSEFYNALKRAELPEWLIEGLSELGIKASNGRFYGTFEVEPTIYTSEWLVESIRRLIRKGIIDKQKDLTATGYNEATIAVMCGIQSPSKNFVKVFLDMYGKYLKPEVKITIKLPKNRIAEIVLPEGYTKEDLEVVKRRLR